MFVLVWGAGYYCLAQGQRRNNAAGKSPKESGLFKTNVPEHDYDLILGRPTNSSVTVSIMPSRDMSGYVVYGQNIKDLTFKSPTISFTANQTTFFDLQGLKGNARYYYKFIYTKEGVEKLSASDLHNFQTARTAGTQFSFDIQADSHLDENTGTDVYTQTLNNIARDSTDFLIDLGDTWMTDKYRNNYKDAYKQYTAQRYYFGIPGISTPVFLTLGNHDGESGQQLHRPEPDNMAKWSTQVRRSFYPNPYPNGFYSGNSFTEGGREFIENYYSWQWGDALFIVLDPFRFTSNNRSPWFRTLGSDQYQWLKRTLEASKAKFKFIFIHNLVGGVDKDGVARGGAEAAGLYEWGGSDTTGQKTFNNNRPDWAMPIHDLLVAHKVNVVFHGHDHFFAKQDKDGIVYQLVPQPGAVRYGNTISATQYGYVTGKIMNAPGYLHVSIDGDYVQIEYIQTSVDLNHQNKQVLYSYQLKP